MSVFSIGKDTKDREEGGVPIAILHGKGRSDGDLVFLDEGNEDESPLDAPDGYKLAIEPTHFEGGRDVIMVGGKSGSGKSHIARNFAIRYNVLHPKNPIFFISYLDEDPTIDEISKVMRRIKPETLLEEDLTVHDFADSLTIIDDVEGYERTNKEIHNKIQSVIDMIATMGRHNSSSIVVCSHLLTDYKRTRLFLGEANHFVVFAHGASQNQLYNLLCRYSGLDKSDVDAIRNLRSRWVCVRTIFPLTVIHENGVYILRPKVANPLKKRRVLLGSQ
jgi:gluconate kinase